MRLIILGIFVMAALHIAIGHRGMYFLVTVMSLHRDEINKDYIQLFACSLSFGRIRFSPNFGIEGTIVKSLEKSGNFCQHTEYKRLPGLPTVDKNAHYVVTVTSTVNITLHVITGGKTFAEGYLALPLTAKSTRFRLASYVDGESDHVQFTVASLLDATNVSIFRANPRRGMEEMTNLSVNAFQVHQRRYKTDVSGVVVSSSTPIAVFGGRVCATIPLAARGACNCILEQLPPENHWGKMYILSSYAGRAFGPGFIVRVIAKRSLTVTFTMQVNGAKQPVAGNTVDVLDGEYHEEIFNGNQIGNQAMVVHVLCTVECMVLQFSTSFEYYKAFPGSAENLRPEASMTLIPPVERYENSAHFPVSSVPEFVSFISVVARSTDVGKLVLDNTPFRPQGKDVLRLKLTMTGQAEYTVILAPMEKGQHIMSSTDGKVPLVVFVYGHAISLPKMYAFASSYPFVFVENDTVLTGTVEDNIAPPNSEGSGGGAGRGTDAIPDVEYSTKMGPATQRLTPDGDGGDGDDGDDGGDGGDGGDGDNGDGEDDWRTGGGIPDDFWQLAVAVNTTVALYIFAVRIVFAVKRFAASA